MNDFCDESSRRKFLWGLACVSASAAISQATGCTQDSHPLPSSTPQKAARSLPSQPFRVAIQGSFAIFVSKQNIMAYAPDVGTHDYYVSDGDYKKCDLGKKTLALSTFGTPDLSLTGLNPSNNPPVFGSTSGSDVIDTDVNPVLSIQDVKRPAQGQYLYAITLPLPTSVSSECLTGKDHGEFFVNPPLLLKDLARVHVFEYADYDLGSLAINGQPIQLPTGETHIKILSEPFSQTASIKECKQHVQRANKALGDMIQVKNGITIREAYCTLIPALLESKKKGKADTGGDGGVVAFSRLPACMSMLINDTTTTAASKRRAA